MLNFCQIAKLFTLFFTTYRYKTIVWFNCLSKNVNENTVWRKGLFREYAPNKCKIVFKNISAKKYASNKNLENKPTSVLVRSSFHKPALKL